MKGTEDLIKNAPLFEKLTEEELTLVARIGHSKAYGKEEVIFLEGGTPEACAVAGWSRADVFCGEEDLVTATNISASKEVFRQCA